jgi:hypothetical protein
MEQLQMHHAIVERNQRRQVDDMVSLIFSIYTSTAPEQSFQDPHSNTKTGQQRECMGNNTQK